jgi:hypothetical protein
MISPWKWLFASLAGVLIAASIVWVARVAMGYGPNPTNLWRNASISRSGSLESLRPRGGGLRTLRTGDRAGNFVSGPTRGRNESRALALEGDEACWRSK